MQHKPFIITIVGPESSGKTTLARELASFHDAPWVPEFARKYRQSSVLSLPPGPLKGVKIEATAQHSFLTFQREEFGEASRPVVIVDSGMMSLRMWARIKYGITIPVVEHALKEDVTSLYILCRPVIEWEADPLREAPRLLDRVWIYNQFLKELSTVRER